MKSTIIMSFVNNNIENYYYNSCVYSLEEEKRLSEFD